MAKSATVVLDDHLEEFLETQIETGKFATESEVLRAGLRALEHQTKLTALRAALEEGERSGGAKEFDFDSFLARMHREHR